jgi:MFS transporter, DHA2 family, multidrug resistance protein
MTFTMSKTRLGTIAVLAAMALVVLDAGVANMALPTLGATFATEPADTILVVTAYQLALVMCLLPCAHIAERVGYRALFVAGISMFIGASLLCALAPTFSLLIAARFLQGTGAAAVMALGVALLRAALGIEHLSSALSWNALTVAICSAIGPPIGALILSLASWHWLFLAGLPVAITALFAAHALPPVPATRASIDLISISLYAVTAAMVVIGAKLGTTHPQLAIMIGIAAVPCITLLLIRELARKSPVVPFDLLNGYAFRVSVVASICCFVGQSAGVVALAFYLQSSLGYSVLVSGLVLTCWPLAVAATNLVANNLGKHFSAVLQCATGGILLSLGLTLSALWPAGNSVIPLILGTLVCGVGFGLFQLANNRTMFLSAPVERSAAAGGMQGTARLTGQTIGTLLVSLVFTLVSSASAPRTGLLVGAAFALLSAIVSLMGKPMSNNTGASALR